MPAISPKILVLGAGGLIGQYTAADLMRRGLQVVAVARHFTTAQRDLFGDSAREIPIAGFDHAALTRFLNEGDVDMVVNCLGVLQDTTSDSTYDIHQAFVGRLSAALRSLRRPVLFVHVSIPGNDADDNTQFSRSKRETEHAIVISGMPHAILRPGFVFAPAAYGGSAMLRALAALPFRLPAQLSSRPFATVAADDIAATIAVLAQLWPQPAHDLAETWDLMQADQRTIGDAVASLRTWLGTASRPAVALPMFLVKFAAKAGDLSAWLGWRPPIRSTALAELQRGVAGDPRAWMDATGIVPRSLDEALRAHPATVQEKWFARLYLLKALTIVSLAVFWCASALIASTVAYTAAVEILTTHGFPDGQAQFMTVAGSVMDFSVGLAIAFRRTSRRGLWAGIVVSFFYMVVAAILMPEIWIEPLGALVKTGPAIVLMLVALAIADDR